MPTYTFRDSNTGEIEEHFMSISLYDQFKISNPHLERIIDAPPLLYSGTGDKVKTDSGFKEVMHKIAEHHPRSAHAEQFLKKDAKRVKTDQVIAKHRKLQNKK